MLTGFINGTTAKIFLIALATLFTAGCDPALFRKPLEDFKTANHDLRDAYFQQLHIAKDARIERFTVGRMDRFWSRGSPADNIKQAAEAVIKIRTDSDDLKPDLLKLRHGAFDAIDGYASILLALASDESTDGIVAEAKGLVGDLGKLVEAAKAVKGLTDAAGKAEAWLGPLANIANVFGDIVKIVSNAVREKAIRETIVAADPSIRGLLEILGNEADWARKEGREQYAAAAQVLNDRLKEGTVDQAAAREVADNLTRISTKAKKLDAAADVKTAFTNAREAHAGLLRKAAKPDYDDLLAELRAFRKNVAALKADLSTIEAQR